MDLTRRGFLGTLTAAMAGFALDPERALWVSGQKTIFLPPPRPTIFTTIEQITQEMCRQLTRELGARYCSLASGDGLMVGSTVRDVVLTDQYNVSVQPRSSVDADEREPRAVTGRIVGPSFPLRGSSQCLHREDLSAAARALATSIKHDGLTMMVPPWVPSGVDAAIATDPFSGVAVRGVRDYSIQRDSMLIRFDVLGARGAHG